MPFAQALTRTVAPATLNGAAIPEVGVARNIALSVLNDIHFGMNLGDGTHALYADLDATVPLERDLIGLGPRTIDIKRRGGRTAEDDWFIAAGRVRARPQKDMDRVRFDNFNRKLAIKPNFPVGAHISGVDVGGTVKEAAPGATHKHQHTGLQMGTRWSKTALESALSAGTSTIHFHLTGMGDLAGPLGKTGNFSHNVTTRELRYVRRFWLRFQTKVIFYNGFTPALLPVIVVPPWIALWQPNTVNCNRCNKPFSRAFPIRYPHHCRLCGLAVCDKCSPARVHLTYPVQRPGSPRETGAARVCTPCYTTFNRAAVSDFL